jgi:hypothetical protein
VKSSHLIVFNLTQEDMLEATRVILCLSAIETEPDFVQLIAEFIFVSWSQTFEDKVSERVGEMARDEGRERQRGTYR